MTSVVEASKKKRNSFSILTRKDLASPTEEQELANGRFIPESKRGWKYDVPYAHSATANVGSPEAAVAPMSEPATHNTTLDAPSSRDVTDQRPKITHSRTANRDRVGGLGNQPARPPRAALSAAVSPTQNLIHVVSSVPDPSSSDSSSSEDEAGNSSSEEGQSNPTGAPVAHYPDNSDIGRHPDDLIYPESYPWKPSRKNPRARYINPAHRNPTAKQAFYDTHFGSSSNYRGLLPASGSLLGFINSSASAETKRRSSDQDGVLITEATGPLEEDAHFTGIVNTMKKPFATAFKLLTKVRPRSSISETASEGVTTEKQTATQPGVPKRPHPVPHYDRGGDELAAQRSGFNYGMSLEDAAQVEAVVSRQSSQDNIGSEARLNEELIHQSLHQGGPSLFKWREAMHNVWGFLPSFDFFASSSAPIVAGSNITGSNLLEPEAIPSVKKDVGAPNYFKNLSGNVVLLGGYRGSVLRDAETHMMMWIPIKVGVGLRRPTLELGLSTAAEDNSEQLVYSSEMCTHIGKLVDMGKRLEERIQARRHAKVYAWGYDWRLSLARSSRRLIAFLEELYESSTDAGLGEKRGAKVVAHSMGGLVALHALATCKNPRIFEGLVFASTPFIGTPNILGPFRFGDAALFNDTICSPRATFSFRSSFYLLPTDGRCFEVPIGAELDEEELTEQQRKERFKDVDFLDPDVWNELGLSPCLEVGRRNQVVALARKGGEGEGQRPTNTNDKEELEREAIPVVRANSATASAELDTASPEGDERGRPNGLTMGVVEGLSDGKPSSTSGQADPQIDADPEEQELLHPENRQGAPRNHPGAASASQSQDAFDRLDYADQSWLYLDRTLAEVRRFWDDIERGFDATKLDKGEYPPLMLMVSGRTPSVRGALVGVDAAYHTKSTDDGAGHRGWKDDVRAGDYSRMTYAAGDGVITRKSATTLPGRWGTLLVKRSEAEVLPKDLCGKGAPFPSTKGKQPGKARLKMDKYRMRFEGEGLVESAHRHVTLLSDVDGIGKCMEAVRRANLVRGRVPLEPPTDRS